MRGIHIASDGEGFCCRNFDAIFTIPAMSILGIVISVTLAWRLTVLGLRYPTTVARSREHREVCSSTS